MKSSCYLSPSHISFPGDCMQKSKLRYCIHKCFDKPDGSVAKPSDFIQFYLYISFTANFYCMSNQTVVLLSALVIVFPVHWLACWQMIDGLGLLLKRPNSGNACRTVAVALTLLTWDAGLMLDCNARKHKCHWFHWDDWPVVITQIWMLRNITLGISLIPLVTISLRCRGLCSTCGRVFYVDICFL